MQAQTTDDVNFTIEQMATPYGTANGETVVNVANKFSVPPAASFIQGNRYGSLTRNSSGPNHPSISFSQSSLLNTFLNNIVKDNNNYFLTYFSKLHLITLHQLYIYLTKIYTSFNLTHVDDLWTYFEVESKQALNTKTLIINHLVNIIEAQINQKVLSYFPGIPQQVATSAGGIFANNDFGSSLQMLINNREEALFENILSENAQDTELVSEVNNFKQQIKTTRNGYLSHYADYLKLFNAYTSSLYSNGSINIDAFIKDAESIQSQIKQPQGPQTGAPISERVQTLRSMQKIDPPLFFYDDETMRGLKLLPALAQRIPEDVESVPWPEKIVSQAKSGSLLRNAAGNIISNNPIAFFADSNGKNLGSTQGSRLFVNIASISGGNTSYIYQQELLPQPEWLNSTKGVMYMLRAVLGDFAILLDSTFSGEYILDPCLMCILQDSASMAGIISSANQSVCDQCTTYLEQLDQLAQSQASASKDQPYIPPLPGGL